MSNGFDLTALGWDGWFATQLKMLDQPDALPARVAVQRRGSYLVYCQEGEVWAELSGRMRHELTRRSELPTVGDWVALRPTDGTTHPIVAMLGRKTKFSRTEVGTRGDESSDRFVRTEEQVLASNLDHVLVVAALTEEFNVKRIERYVTMIWEGGAIPVVVLNKADLCDPTVAIAEASAAAPGVDVLALSAHTGDGVDALRGFLAHGSTIALVGSSGVGKTSLLNRFTGDEQRPVQETRSDSRGRHTTSHRELILLATGGMIIDTPGIRELQLWNSVEGIDRAFDDITGFASSCRFNDCSHEKEPGCAVRQALEEGQLDEQRFQSYQKLRRELDFLERRQDPRLERETRERWKALTKSMRKR